MLPFVTSLLIAVAPTAASAKPNPPTPGATSVELGDFDGRRRSVRVRVNGHDGLFLLDTGGGVTLVSPEFAKKIGCTPWGAHTGFRLTGERLDLPRCDDLKIKLTSGEQLRPVSAGVIDVRSLLWENAPPVDGSLALDAFEGRQFTLDLGTGLLTFETPESLAARTRRSTEIPMRQVRQVAGHALGAAVPVPTPKGNLWMTIDSGSSAPVLLRDVVAADAGAKPGELKLQPFSLTIGSKVSNVVTATHAGVRDMILDGVIGLPVLVQWSMTFDLQVNRLWVSKTR